VQLVVQLAMQLASPPENYELSKRKTLMARKGKRAHTSPVPLIERWI
jgi:hypothetical protein